jgi:hypothetical protein
MKFLWQAEAFHVMIAYLSGVTPCSLAKIYQLLGVMGYRNLQNLLLGAVGSSETFVPLQGFPSM